ncbi:MAG: lysophospholipid acyltransferase family protein [Elusimicrobiota bacterium]
MKKRFIRYCIYIGAKWFSYLVLLIPYALAVKCGGILGRLVYCLLPSARYKAVQNLKPAFPDKSDKEINKITKDMFSHLGKNLFEFLSFPKLTKRKLEKLVTVTGSEYLEEAIKNGRGIIFCTGHIGNWEIFAAYYAMLNYPVNVLAKRVYDDRLNDMLSAYRMSKGVKPILRSEGTKDLIRALKNNEFLGLLIDQDTNVKNCFVKFFNRDAATPVGAAALALKYNTPVLVAYIHRTLNNHHKITVLPVTLDKTGDTQKDIEYNTGMLTKMLEDAIRKEPSQWVWIHERWKTKKR